MAERGKNLRGCVYEDGASDISTGVVEVERAILAHHESDREEETAYWMQRGEFEAFVVAGRATLC